MPKEDRILAILLSIHSVTGTIIGVGIVTFFMSSDVSVRILGGVVGTWVGILAGVAPLRRPNK